MQLSDDEFKDKLKEIRTMYEKALIKGMSEDVETVDRCPVCGERGSECTCYDWVEYD